MPAVQPRLRIHPIVSLLAFAVLCAFVYRLRGGGFGVNEWKPIAIHSRFIAWMPQTLLYIIAARCFVRRPRSDGLWLGLLWLFAVLPGWGAWQQPGIHRQTQRRIHSLDDPPLSWIGRVHVRSG